MSRADFLFLSPSEFNEERLFLGKSRAEIQRFNYTYRKSALRKANADRLRAYFQSSVA
jgi:hypothetical protein